MLRAHRLLPAAMIAAALGACAPTSGLQSGPAPSEGRSASVRVTNNNWADMTVYMLRAGMRVRLGTVTSMATQSFRIPPSVLGGEGDVRLVADPIGSRETHLTLPVQVWPGQTVAFKIENHIAVSSVSVW